MKVHVVYTKNQLRNFTYIIEMQSSECLVLDPWDDSQVDQELDKFNLRLKAIINTHEHFDHTQGNQALFNRHNCEVWAHNNGEGKIPCLSRTLSKDEIIPLGDGFVIKVLDTPGHTFAHLCFLILENEVPRYVFTGDTLFNAGVGNCHNGGDPQVMYQTIKDQFHTLPDSVCIYPGHDYLENNLEFTLSLEPDNQSAKEWLAEVKKVDPSINPLLTSIGDEREFNTFFRLNNHMIKESLSLESAEEKEVFLALREKRNSW
tara:strand:+ start:5684 stop:6463 length:780 start_codon:yes stop_codon:yes gene_type:complete